MNLKKELTAFEKFKLECKEEAEADVHERNQVRIQTVYKMNVKLFKRTEALEEEVEDLKLVVDKLVSRMDAASKKVADLQKKGK